MVHLSELPLGQILLPLLAGESRFPFFFFRIVSVRLLSPHTARDPGAVACPPFPLLGVAWASRNERTSAAVRQFYNVGAQAAMLSPWHSAWSHTQAPLDHILQYGTTGILDRALHTPSNPTEEGQTEPINAEHGTSHEAGDGAHCGREGGMLTPGSNLWQRGRVSGFHGGTILTAV